MNLFRIALAQTYVLESQQSTRIELAKRVLENETQSLDEITCHVESEDSSMLRKQFSEISGLVTKAYRSKFQRQSAI